MAAFRPGQRLDGYEIIDVLGQGGMGTVYRAVQLSMRRHVALKVLAPELAERDPSFCERFVAEARAAGRLNHPNIISVHDVGQTVIDEHQVFYYVMELIEGQDCKMLLRQNGRLDAVQVTSIASGVAAALVYAEGVGIVHRDIKPENIMLTSDGMIKLADLGLALQLDQVEAVESQGDRRVMGTPRYMSPEQARGRPVDHRSDQYCLGAALFHLLTGEPPYQATTSKELMRAHVLSPVPDPRLVSAEISEPWRRMLMTMLAKRPEERYPSAEALLNAIRSVSDGRIPSQPPAPGFSVTKKRHQRGLVIAGGALGLLVLILLLRHLVSAPSSTEPRTPTDEDPVTTPDMPSSSEARRLRAERLVADLPEDHEAAVKELRQQARNPYFSGHEAAEAVLQEALKQRQHSLWQERSQQRDQAKASLQRIHEHIEAGQLAQAATALAEQAPELQKLLPEPLEQTQQALQKAVEQAARAVFTRIEQAQSAEAVDQALQAYQQRLAPEQRHEDVAKRADARKQHLQAERLAAEQRSLEAQRRQEQETWSRMRSLLLASRGESRMGRHVQALQEAAETTKTPALAKRYQRLASTYAAMADIETLVADWAYQEQPLISLSGMDRDAILLGIDGNRVAVRTLYPNGTLEVARDSVELDWSELAREALRSDNELVPAIPHWLWHWRVGGEAPPDLLEEQAEAPTAPKQEAVDTSADQVPDIATQLAENAALTTDLFTLDFAWKSDTEGPQPPWREQSEPAAGAVLQQLDSFLTINDFSLNKEQALASFLHFGGQANGRIAQPVMHVQANGMRWSCSGRMPRSAILEQHIPLSVLQRSIAQGISLDCQLGSNALILIGLAQRGHRIRIGFDTRGDGVVVAVFITDERGRLIHDPRLGMARLRERNLHLEWRLVDGASLTWSINGQSWMDLARGARAGGARFPDTASSIQDPRFRSHQTSLIIQGFAHGREPASLLLQQIAIE